MKIKVIILCVLVLSGVQTFAQEKQKRNQTQNQRSRNVSNAWNQAHIDYQLSEDHFIFQTTLQNQNSNDATIKQSGAKFASFDQKITVMSLNSEYGYSDQTSFSLGIQLALDYKTITKPVASSETTFKTKGISNPKLAVQHRFADGLKMNEWIPSVGFAFSPNFKDNEYSDDEQTLRSGGHELEAMFGLTERSETSILGFKVGYYLPFERNAESTTDGEVQTTKGGEILSMGVSWQYLIDNNTLGVSFELSNIASQRTDTKDGATTSFSNVSSITQTGLGLLGSIQLTEETVLQGQASYIIPFEYDTDTGGAPIEVENGATTVLAISLSSVF